MKVFLSLRNALVQCGYRAIGIRIGECGRRGNRAQLNAESGVRGVCTRFDAMLTTEVDVCRYGRAAAAAAAATTTTTTTTTTTSNRRAGGSAAAGSGRRPSGARQRASMQDDRRRRGGNLGIPLRNSTTAMEERKNRRNIGPKKKMRRRLSSKRWLTIADRVSKQASERTSQSFRHSEMAAMINADSHARTHYSRYRYRQLRQPFKISAADDDYPSPQCEKTEDDSDHFGGRYCR